MLEFDQTRIAIRERTFTDILDLSLRVLRRHAVPFSLALAAGVVPMAILNAWLLGGLVSDASEGLLLEEEYFAFLAGYGFWLTVLVIAEVPFATALATLYLGEALHNERPRAGIILRRFVGSLPQLILLQGPLRLIMALMVVTWLPLYVLWPYMNEVILLERNRLVRWGPQRSGTLRRISLLHTRSSGDLFARWVGAIAVGLLGVLALWMAIWYVEGMLTNGWEFDGWDYLVFLQVAIWSWVGFFTVARFLSYLDVRIRNEGWEVELMTRAEAIRLTRQAA